MKWLHSSLVLRWDLKSSSCLGAPGASYIEPREQELDTRLQGR